MNKANKKSIGWTDYTWNPIKGICPVGCWYCYGKRYYQRFKRNPKVYFDYREADKVNRLINSSKIFVCSTFELFHPITLSKFSEHPDSFTWRDIIFLRIKYNRRHIFQILTKFPENIDRHIPDNIWLGITITGLKKEWEAFRMGCLIGKNIRFNNSIIKFISFEPLLKRFTVNVLTNLKYFDWVIVGKMTQHGKKYDPQKVWIEDIVYWAKKYSIPIFLKDNLKEIWGEPLIQEFPNV